MTTTNILNFLTTLNLILTGTKSILYLSVRLWPDQVRGVRHAATFSQFFVDKSV